MNSLTTTTSSSGVEILIVDDTNYNIKLLTNILTEHSYIAHGANNGSEALEIALTREPSLILLDINMPGMSGYEVCERLKANPISKPIPVIFISALGEVWDKVRAFDVGGVDYITKPFQEEEILARVANHLTLRQLQLELEQANADLESKVQQRTIELARTVIALENEIRERQREEQQRISLEQQLHEAQKMEALGRMAGGVAHDINNIFSIISGFTSLIQLENKDNERLLQRLTQIQQANKRATNLTRELVSFSRNQQLIPQSINLNQMLQSMENQFSPLLKPNQSLQLRLAPELGNVKLDMVAFERVIINLVVNACDAMTNGGMITISTDNLEWDSARAGCNPRLKSGSYVRLSVADTGTGMDKETINRIFEPYFTTKDPDKGTGLGLATVHGIITQSNGAIEVDSELGRGTTFHLFLPRI